MHEIYLRGNKIGDDGAKALAEALKVITDGIGTPDPNPMNLVNWCFYYNLVYLAFF